MNIMKKKLLGVLIQSWCKSLHVLFACLWLGAVAAVVLIYVLTDPGAEEAVVIQASELMDRIDKIIIIPSSSLCYGLGLLISWKTKWGFFRFKWIAAKVVLGTLLMLFGIFFLGPWVMASDSLLARGDFDAYRQIQAKLGASMIVQLVVIIAVVFISTIKPWGKLNT